MDRTQASFRFAQDVSRYNLIAAPFAHAIRSLEHSDTTAADVFAFWTGIQLSLRKLFAQGEHITGIGQDLEQQVTDITNRRYKQFVDDGPSDIYFSAFFLDPSTSHPLAIVSMLYTHHENGRILTGRGFAEASPTCKHHHSPPQPTPG